MAAGQPSAMGMDESKGAPLNGDSRDPMEQMPLLGGDRVTRLALVTDAWHPQTNGVVHTLSRLVRHLESLGAAVLVISPDGQETVPLPSYPEIRLSSKPWRAVDRLLAFRPDAVHIATEGPLGLWVRQWLGRKGLNFTTSFHTRFPEYLRERLPVPVAWTYRLERWFHGRAEHTLVGTQSLIRELQARGVGRRLVHWPRGVDAEAFNPIHRRPALFPHPGPIWLYVGRVAVEKNLHEFLRLTLPGTKVVVGDGPARAELQRAYPETVWQGWRHGDELAAHFASADCFVFPSRTETFGNVILEALASGLPVASFPAPGPTDLIEDGVTGTVGEDLLAGCLRARRCTREAARAAALRYTWAASHARFRAHLVPLVRREDAPPLGQEAAAC